MRMNWRESRRVGVIMPKVGNRYSDVFSSDSDNRNRRLMPRSDAYLERNPILCMLLF
jgi:hypothetical protein